jgi:hypothetical protein
MICTFGGKMSEKNYPGQDVAEDRGAKMIPQFLKRQSSISKRRENLNKEYQRKNPRN